MIAEDILTSALVSVVTFVFTYLGTSMIQKNEAKTAMKESVLEHEKIHHQETVYAVVQRHLDNCSAADRVESLREEIGAIKAALIFLVAEQKGDPKKLGLVR